MRLCALIYGNYIYTHSLYSLSNRQPHRCLDCLVGCVVVYQHVRSVSTVVPTSKGLVTLLFIVGNFRWSTFVCLSVIDLVRINLLVFVRVGRSFVNNTTLHRYGGSKRDNW